MLNLLVHLIKCILPPLEGVEGNEKGFQISEGIRLRQKPLFIHVPLTCRRTSPVNCPVCILVVDCLSIFSKLAQIHLVTKDMLCVAARYPREGYTPPELSTRGQASVAFVSQ